MADVVLSAELQARVDSFVANLLAAANSADNTSNSVTQMSTNISRNIANVNRTNLSQFTAAMNAGTLSVTRLGAAVPAITRPLTVGTNQAANALTNLGRVAQDAPFGFIGIQNNLNPLLESFQRLRVETGSNGAAFRALGQSLLGPAGLGIALSVVTSAITLYTMYQQKANKELSNAKKSATDYIDTLDGVSGALLKGTENGAKEIAQLNVLMNIYQNVNLPLKKRKEAYEEIQRIYPDYFGNIKFEEKATNSLNGAYIALTASIISSAKARALSEKIGSNATAEEETLNKIRNIDAAIQKSRKSDTSYAAALGGSKETQDLLEEQISLQKNFNNLKQEDLRLQEKITDEVIAGASIPNNFASPGGKSDKKTTVKLKDLDLELPENPDKIFEDLFKKLSAINAPGALTVKAPEKIKLDGTKAQLDLGDLVEVTGVEDLIKSLKIKEDFEKYFQVTKKALEDFLSLQGQAQIASKSIGEVGTAIGESLANGSSVLAAIGTSLLSSFGGFLSQFGDLLIEYGVAALIKSQLDAALLVPGAGLIAGPAAIAAGIALKVAAGAISSFVSGQGKSSGKGGVTAFANGGIISGPTLGLMGEYAGAKSDPEVVAPLSKLKNLLGETDAMGNTISTNGDNYFFDQRVEIEGDKLVVLLERTQAKRKRFK